MARWKAGFSDEGGFTGGYADAEPRYGDRYTLHLSVEAHPVPEPAALVSSALGAAGLIGLCAWRGRGV